MLVTMHFGDGSQKLVNVEATDPTAAVEEARDWVMDNAWFETLDVDDQITAECRLDSNMSR